MLCRTEVFEGLRSLRKDRCHCVKDFGQEYSPFKKDCSLARKYYSPFVKGLCPFGKTSVLFRRTSIL